MKGRNLKSVDDELTVFIGLFLEKILRSIEFTSCKN